MASGMPLGPRRGVAMAMASPGAGPPCRRPPYEKPPLPRMRRVREGGRSQSRADGGKGRWRGFEEVLDEGVWVALSTAGMVLLVEFLTLNQARSLALPLARVLGCTVRASGLLFI